MLFTTTQLSAWLGDFLWPLMRVAMLFSVAPIFGGRLVPARVRLVLAVMVTWVLVPVIPSAPAVDPLSAAGVLIIAQQLLIGLVMGLMLQLVFTALMIGGQVVAMGMGLGFAAMADPQNGVQVPVIAQFYLILATLLFLLSNGHLLAIELVADSFQTLPVAVDGITRNGLLEIIAWGSRLFAGGLLVSLPIVGAMLMVNMGMGVVMRAAPQLNIFSVGFPVTMLLGFALMWVSLPSVFAVFNEIVEEAFQLMMQLLRVTR